MPTINDCRIIELPCVRRREGNLTAVHGDREVPFTIARAYYLYDIPGGASRGGHAHKELQQLIVSVMGAFDVIVDDGISRKAFRLERAYYGLYIPKMIWRELDNFSSGGISLVLASLPYSEEDYIRNYEDYLKRVNIGRS
jgi:hypothetical protein